MYPHQDDPVSTFSSSRSTCLPDTLLVLFNVSKRGTRSGRAFRGPHCTRSSGRRVGATIDHRDASLLVTIEGTRKRTFTLSGLVILCPGSRKFLSRLPLCHLRCSDSEKSYRGRVTHPLHEHMSRDLSCSSWSFVNYGSALVLSLRLTGPYFKCSILLCHLCDGMLLLSSYVPLP